MNLNKINKEIEELIEHLKSQKQTDSFGDKVLEFNGVIKNLREFKDKLNATESK